MWHPAVRYRYRAGAETLFGETIRLYDDDALWYSSPNLARSAGRKWKKGLKVRLYFNPANPEESCLEAITTTPYLFMGFVTLWMVIIPFMTHIMG